VIGYSFSEVPICQLKPQPTIAEVQLPLAEPIMSLYHGCLKNAIDVMTDTPRGTSVLLRTARSNCMLELAVTAPSVTAGIILCMLQEQGFVDWPIM